MSCPDGINGCDCGGLGGRLIRLRRAKGLTQERASGLAGIAFNGGGSALVFWESGKKKPSLHSLFLIAKFYGVTVDYLITGREP